MAALFENEMSLSLNSLLDQHIITVLESIEIKTFFPLQKKVIEYILKSYTYPLFLPDVYSRRVRDVAIAASTGEGKTFCYVIPIVQSLLTRSVRLTRCVVIVPTRELATQVHDVFELFVCRGSLSCSIMSVLPYCCRSNPLKVLSFFGEKALSLDLRDVELGVPDIIVCTPGRLCEHFSIFQSKERNFLEFGNARKGIDFSFVRWVVIDEIDRLLEQPFNGWIDVVSKICECNIRNDQIPSSKFSPGNSFDLPSLRCVQKIFLSATISTEALKVSPLDVHDLVSFVSTLKKDKYRLPKLLSEFFIKTISKLKIKTLIYLLTQLYCLFQNSFDNGISASGKTSTVQTHDVGSSKFFRVFLFCSNVDAAHKLTRILQLYFHSSSCVERPEKVKVPYRTSDCNNEITNFANSTVADFSELPDPFFRDADVKRYFSVAEFSSRLKQSDRASVLGKFRAGKINVLVCSDLLARGMDMKGVEFVVNYNVPINARSYVQRAGRTARAATPGRVYTLITDKELRGFRMLLRYTQSTSRRVQKHVVSPSQLNFDIRKIMSATRKILKLESKGKLQPISSISFEKLEKKGFFQKNIYKRTRQN